MRNSEIIEGLKAAAERARERYIRENDEEAKEDNDILLAAIDALEAQQNPEEERPVSLAGAAWSDVNLIRELDVLVEKIRKQAEPDPGASAMIGAMNPLLKAALPMAKKGSQKDYRTITRVRARLVELSKAQG